MSFYIVISRMKPSSGNCPIMAACQVNADCGGGGFCLGKFCMCRSCPSETFYLFLFLLILLTCVIRMSCMTHIIFQPSERVPTVFQPGVTTVTWICTTVIHCPPIGIVSYRITHETLFILHYIAFHFLRNYMNSKTLVDVVLT